ncbi:S8 family peptidase [Frateuria sp. GZRR35]|uniref:S8 family peptidase n=1 Tax=unclassified Frateuria TaxID=2648894 RepID=UPI003EDC7F0A
MASEPKFLLGRGETLNRESRYRSGPNDAQPPYVWDIQRAHLLPLMATQQDLFRRLPPDACPGDRVVSAVTLHPQYYSRSAFPSELVGKMDLRLVGSKPVMVKPRDGRGSDKERGIPSTVLFLAGRRSQFQRLLDVVSAGDIEDSLVVDLLKIESLSAMQAKDRLMGSISSAPELVEVVMHHDAELDVDWEEAFLDFASESGVELDQARDYQSRGLWFMPAMASAAAAARLANFAFVRAIRPMPKLRPLKRPQMLRALEASPHIALPSEEAIDSSFRVAIFDGGLPDNHPFGLWANRIEPSAKDGIGAPIIECVEHGLAVTSALLFGSVGNGLQPRPYSGVDHFRVLGDQTTDTKLYPVMLYIDQILSQSNYEFATLSIGPVEIVGDDKVTAWTTMLDDHFQQGQMLGTIAVGNAGESPSPLNRVQVPSDCVNALAIGASSSEGAGWARAPYSCVGPGRAPGLVKPDLLQFGGVDGDQFKFIFPGPTIAEASGTSFSTPAVMRIASGVRAHFGGGISTVGIRALLIHSAENPGEHPRAEVGWGLVPSDLSAITVCPDGSVRVLYQGHLDPSKVIRTEVPLPPGELEGLVEIAATFCYLCQTDPHTPGDYTRAGLGITFRPHQQRFPKPSPPNYRTDPDFPESKPFFEGVGRKTEQALRHDSFKWDTTRHARQRFRASSLDRPVFDIHYQAREPGSRVSPSAAIKLPYALVVTVTASKHPDLYDRVVAHYPTLAAIRPRTHLPLPIRV